MTHLRNNTNPKNDLPNSDWVSVKEVAPFKVVENKWIFWASWGMTLVLPITLVLFTVFKLIN